MTVIPLDPSAVGESLRAVGGEAMRLDSVAANWQLWAEDCCLVCNRYTTSRRALAFVIRLVRATGCQMFDSNLYPVVGLESLERQLSLARRWSD